MYQKFINLVLVLAKTHYNCYFDKGVRVTKKKKSLKGAQGFVRKPLAFGQKFREKKAVNIFCIVLHSALSPRGI